MNKRVLLISAVVFIIVAIGGVIGYRYIQSKKVASQVAPDLQSAANATENILQNATQGVLPGIGEAANPLTNKPDLNPADKTNPFNSIKTNPFE